MTLDMHDSCLSASVHVKILLTMLSYIVSLSLCLVLTKGNALVRLVIDLLKRQEKKTREDRMNS